MTEDPRTVFHHDGITVTVDSDDEVWLVQMLCAMAMAVLAELRANPVALMREKRLEHVLSVGTAYVAAQVTKLARDGQTVDPSALAEQMDVLHRTAKLIRAIGTQSGEHVILQTQRMGGGRDDA